MQPVGLVLIPLLAGHEKAAGAIGSTPLGKGRENVQGQILSIRSGILPSALPRASRFREKQTNKNSPPASPFQHPWPVVL